MNEFWQLCLKWAWLGFLLEAIESPARYVAYMMKEDPATRMLYYSIGVNARVKEWSIFAACVAIGKWVLYAMLLIFFGCELCLLAGLPAQLLS